MNIKKLKQISQKIKSPIYIRSFMKTTYLLNPIDLAFFVKIISTHIFHFTCNIVYSNNLNINFEYFLKSGIRYINSIKITHAKHLILEDVIKPSNFDKYTFFKIFLKKIILTKLLFHCIKYSCFSKYHIKY